MNSCKLCCAQQMLLVKTWGRRLLDRLLWALLSARQDPESQDGSCRHPGLSLYSVSWCPMTYRDSPDLVLTPELLLLSNLVWTVGWIWLLPSRFDTCPHQRLLHQTQKLWSHSICFPLSFLNSWICCLSVPWLTRIFSGADYITWQQFLKQFSL